MKKFFIKTILLSVLLLVSVQAGFMSRAAEFPVVKDTKVLETAQKTGISPYAGYMWRLDAADRDRLPRNFRTVRSAYRNDVNLRKTGPGFTRTPSRKGLENLRMSGSGQFSTSELKAMLPVLQKQAQGGPIYIVDLRQETHGFFAGNAVSWYGARDWGNIGKNKIEVLADERERLQAAKGQTLTVAALDKNKKPIDAETKIIHQALTEEQLVTSQGLHYYRIAATDHRWPSPENIDAFIHFVQTLPQNAWLHFHCQAGAGRTTVYMAMYDILKNPSVPLDDILSRQYLLGGTYVAYTEKHPCAADWKAPYYQEKATMIQRFYQYVQQNYRQHFHLTWSKWLTTHDKI